MHKCFDPLYLTNRIQALLFCDLRWGSTDHSRVFSDEWMTGMAVVLKLEEDCFSIPCLWLNCEVGTLEP